MKALKQNEKSKGVILFAYNTETVDYVSIAESASKLIKHHLKLPVTLVTDNEVTSSWFDSVITSENNLVNSRVGYKNSTQWRNGGRYQAYNLSPYDETILLDSDYLVMSNNLLKLLNNTSDYRIMHQNKFLNSNPSSSMGIISLDFLWATVIVFRKTEHSEILFDLVKKIQENYDYYCKLYHISSTNFRNDFAFTIANHILNGYSTDLTKNIPWQMLTVDGDIKTIDYKDNQLIIRQDNAKIVSKQDLHVMDKEYLLSDKYQELIQTVCQE